ncbi:jg17945 [Pararge aegeria aegeria]|uniref:Jg17945 protein n=1 Tax=Pararge aegeria aegeria TaxID=348720 RepID=A0A8S4RBT4_9NEOP|nr:jg17945 [Pararge aegeria aegeria]
MIMYFLINLISQDQAQKSIAQFPELHTLDGAAEYIATPDKSKVESPEAFFSKKIHGKEYLHSDMSRKQNSSFANPTFFYSTTSAITPGGNWAVVLFRSACHLCGERARRPTLRASGSGVRAPRRHGNDTATPPRLIPPTTHP